MNIAALKKIALVLTLLTAAGYAGAARAQDAAATTTAATPSSATTETPEALVDRKLRAVEPGMSDMGSLFFTPWQHALLQEAKRGFLSRPPTQAEIAAGTETDPMARPRGIRELSLGGIVYAAPKDWVIWLNGQRITPDALPTQVIDLKVGKEYVELKWFDTYSNLIYPVRIRPHQRFNLDSRIFLPGAGVM